ncbi:MAG: GNAT family N-acetyltransferase [Myxococcales bacterium]|jgi:GNAT superfamily N-acetyltransferase
MCAAVSEVSARKLDGVPCLRLPVGGGLAVYGAAGSPLNKLIGLGFDGPVVAHELERAEAEFSARGARLQAEVSTLADAELHGVLCARGYVPSGFENVLGHPLLESALTRPAAPEIAVSAVAPHEHGLFAELMVAAVATPDIGGVGGDATPPSELIRHWVLAMLALPDVHGYLARIDGAVAGAASMCLDDEVAQFTGAGTLPEFRRRGVQSALLTARLAAAARAKCQVAVVTTQPASKSQQNVQLAGFGLLYARQLLVKEPALR